MEIDQSSLYREVQKIISGGEKPVHQYWTAQIHVGDNETPILPLAVISIDVKNDYLNNYAVEHQVTMLIPAGTYAVKIYPYLDQIDVTLMCIPIGETSDSIDEEAQVSVERYTATLIDTGNPIIEMSSRNVPDETALNLSGAYEVTFQLVDKFLEKIRMVSVGGIYHNVTGENVIKGILSQKTKEVKLSQDRMIQGIDMVAASNQKKRDHIVVPHGLSIMNLPEHVHFKCGGVYSSGLGHYLTRDYWYIFPCFDVTRFNKVHKTLTVINVPPNRFPGIERTYRLDGDNLVIISTGQVKFRDQSNVMQLNAGNGVRFTDASQLMEAFTTTHGNKTIASRGNTNNEFVSEDRKNGNNLVPLSRNPITDNPFVEYSSLALRQGSVISLVWENAKRDVLYPGMPVKIMYLDGDNIKELYGVLLMEHGFISRRERGITSHRHVTSSMLGVFVKPLEDEEVNTTS